MFPYWSSRDLRGRVSESQPLPLRLFWNAVECNPKAPPFIVLGLDKTPGCIRRVLVVSSTMLARAIFFYESHPNPRGRFFLFTRYRSNLLVAVLLARRPTHSDYDTAASSFCRSAKPALLRLTNSTPRADSISATRSALRT